MNDDELEAYYAHNRALVADRSGLLDRAQALIDWLREHPDVPVSSVHLHGSLSAETASDAAAEFDAIVAATGLPVAEGKYGGKTAAWRGADDPAGIVSYTVGFDPSWYRRRR